ncbi:hypothetical protein HK097_009263 [Rhizophlyctis rosea]|uniref:Fe2OG dioxygenase domain-containing protein n=1 Tax=Rhizophlyctis rosea TaxID=64517 RepID=A0AAD5SK73_9FUNG|nr:hypothetical protein HK097_009263 [Rhizophlyctis rosea]
MSAPLAIPFLPIIDITPLADPNPSPPTAAARRSTIEQLSAACVYHGAFYIKSAEIGGLTRELRSKVFESAKRVFAVSESVKKEYNVVREEGKEGFTRGYIGVGGESGSAALEVKEAFSYGDPDTAQRLNALSGPNVWPSSDDLPVEARNTLEAFYRGLVEVAQTVTRGLSLALGHSETFLSDGYCKGGEKISLLRLFRYFPASAAANLVSEESIANATGSSAHTDWGFLTLILQQDGITGLQIASSDPEDPAKTEWVDIPPIPGTLLVNAGDYLSLLTNGRVVSPLHRVVSPKQERLSAVFFYYPDYDARIPVLSGDGEGGDSGSIARLSLFRDQSIVLDESERLKEDGEPAAGQLQAVSSAKPPGRSNLDAEALSKIAFGDYISAKWAQVARNGYA